MALSSQHRYRAIWQAFLEGQFILCVSNEILEEYVEVIGRNISPHIADMVIYTLLMRKNIQRFDPHFRFQLIDVDPDDNKFVDCAIVSGAKYIVSEDHHFNVLQRIDFPKVDVIGIDQFLNDLQGYII